MKSALLLGFLLAITLLAMPCDCSPPSIAVKGVEPVTGDPSTEFTFACSYSDPDGDEALFVRIEIDGTLFNMSKGTGENYTYKTRISTGIHSVRYLACNVDGECCNTTITTLYVNPQNSAPTLKNLSVSPNSGDESTIFTFTVVYLDADNSQPRFVKVAIDNVEHIMGLHSQDDNESVYTYSTTLSAGLHLFVFSCDDGSNAENAATQSAPLSILVGKVNRAPSLYFDQVIPSTGNEGTAFNFSVAYKDEDGNMPKYVKLVLDGNAIDAGIQKGTDISMGVTYEFKMHLASGTHTYYFICDDNSGAGNAKASTNENTLVVAGSIQGNELAIYIGIVCIAIIALGGLGLYMLYRKKKSAPQEDVIEEVDAELEEITDGTPTASTKDMHNDVAELRNEAGLKDTKKVEPQPHEKAALTNGKKHVKKVE